MSIIDIHTHVFPDRIAQRASEGIGAFYDIPVRYDGRLDTLFVQGDSAGITHYLIHAVATNPNQAHTINDFLASTVRAAPQKLSGFAGIHPDMADPLSEIARARTLGLKGVKLHPDIQRFNVDDPRMFPLYEAMGSHMTLLTHAGDTRYDYSSPARLRRVRDNFPNLTMICAHMGGWSVWPEAQALLCNQRIHVDTSSTLSYLPPAQAKALIRAYGAQWVLFGTDYPVWDASEELGRVDELKLSQEEREAILHGNAEELLGLG